MMERASYAKECDVAYRGGLRILDSVIKFGRHTRTKGQSSIYSCEYLHPHYLVNVFY